MPEIGLACGDDTKIVGCVIIFAQGSSSSRRVANVEVIESDDTFILGLVLKLW
jgi:hypothetical protein